MVVRQAERGKVWVTGVMQRQEKQRLQQDKVPRSPKSSDKSSNKKKDKRHKKLKKKKDKKKTKDKKSKSKKSKGQSKAKAKKRKRDCSSTASSTSSAHNSGPVASSASSSSSDDDARRCVRHTDKLPVVVTDKQQDSRVGVGDGDDEGLAGQGHDTGLVAKGLISKGLLPAAAQERRLENIVQEELCALDHSAAAASNEVNACPPPAVGLAMSGMDKDASGREGKRARVDTLPQS